MKAFNMIFVAAYAFCICLQTRVLGDAANNTPKPQEKGQDDNQVVETGPEIVNRVDNNDPPVPNNCQENLMNLKNCSKLYPDDSVVCQSSLLYSGLLNFPAHLLRTANGNSKDNSEGTAQLENFRTSTKTFEEYGITFKNYYWVGNDQCLSQTLLDKAKQGNIEVIYKKKYFQNLLEKKSLPESAVEFRDKTPAFARIIDFNLSWNITPKIVSPDLFSNAKGEKITMRFLALEAEAFLMNSDIAVAKVAFKGNGNLFALFVLSDKHDFFLNVEDFNEDHLPAAESRIFKIPNAWTFNNPVRSLRKFPSQESGEQNEVLEEITNVACLDFNVAGFGSEVVREKIPDFLDETLMTVHKFASPFHFYIMRESDNFPVFHAFIETFEVQDQ